jgi:chitin disaccharide deacetylase
MPPAPPTPSTLSMPPAPPAPPAPRNLIVNADDLGLSPAVNAGVLRAHAGGLVTSASLMVRKAAADEAVRLARDHPELALGLHLDLGQWDFQNGAWTVAYARCDQADGGAVRAECRSQLDLFRQMTGRDPTHLDSHQHVHLHEPVSSIAAEIAAEVGVPLRGRQIRYEGGFYGQTGQGEPLPETITVAHLCTLIRSLAPGWTELGCHPGVGVSTAESSYARERERELEALCDPSLAIVLAEESVRLCSFAELGVVA